MLSKNINFKNFGHKSKNLKLKKDLKNILNQNSEILQSLTTGYKYQYSKNLIKKIKKEKNLKIIGMGGSILGAQAIHDFLKHKIKKNVIFYNNLDSNLKNNNKSTSIIISKSGNTHETI